MLKRIVTIDEDKPVSQLSNDYYGLYTSFKFQLGEHKMKITMKTWEIIERQIFSTIVTIRFYLSLLLLHARLILWWKTIFILSCYSFFFAPSLLSSFSIVIHIIIHIISHFFRMMTKTVVAGRVNKNFLFSLLW